MKSITVSIDPSSTATGIAIFRGKKLVSVELIRSKAKKTVPPHQRAIDMAHEILRVVSSRVDSIDANPKRIRLSVVVEVPGGQGRAHSRGLVTMGMAVGAACSLLSQWAASFPGSTFEMVLAAAWTRLDRPRPMSKEQRADLIVERFASWDFSGDSGHDMKDAVGLGAWKLDLI